MGGTPRHRTRRALLAGFGALLVVAGSAGIAAGAATPWQSAEVSPSGDLSSNPRVFASASTLGDGSRAVLFGGGVPDSVTPYADTWVFDGHEWMRACGDPAEPSDACGPGGRLLTGLAGTPDGAVLYGGTSFFDLTDAMADEWSVDASTGEWTPICGTGALPVCAPGPRTMHAMAGHGGRVVLFGGTAGEDPLSDTWVSDDSGVTWTQTCGGSLPACGPASRMGASLAWDGAHFVLFGGMIPSGSSNTLLADTWVFDGKTWSPVCGTGTLPACGPGGRSFAAFSGIGTPDPGRPRALLVGGADTFNRTATTIFKDAWLWDGATWTGQPVPWDDAAVSFPLNAAPPVGPDPLVVVAGGIDCRVVVTGPNVAGGRDYFGTQRTFLFGEDPSGCPTTPPPPAAAAPAAAVPTARLAYTGRSSTSAMLAGLFAVLTGGVLMAVSRRRRGLGADRPGPAGG